MHLSRESEYGLKAMIYLAQQLPATVLALHQIAEARDLTVGSAVFYDTQVKVEGVDDD